MECVKIPTEDILSHNGTSNTGSAEVGETTVFIGHQIRLSRFWERTADSCILCHTEWPATELTATA